MRAQSENSRGAISSKCSHGIEAIRAKPLKSSECIAISLSRTLTEFNMNSTTIRAGLKRPAGSERPTLSNVHSTSLVR